MDINVIWQDVETGMQHTFEDGDRIVGVPVYINGTTWSYPLMWTFSATTTSWVATFYPTDDGTINGTPIFTTIHSIQATAVNDTALATASPWCSIKTSSTTKIEVNVSTGTILGVLWATALFASDGTTVYLTVYWV